MINYITFLVCLQISTSYKSACSTSLKALSIQSGVQVYSDALDKHTEALVRHTIRDIELDERIIGALYLSYQLGVKDNVTIPIPYHPISDSLVLNGSKHSLGLSLTWIY